MCIKQNWYKRVTNTLYSSKQTCLKLTFKKSLIFGERRCSAGQVPWPQTTIQTH